MEKKFDKAVFDIAKVDALMYAYENAFLTIGSNEQDRERVNQGINAFYALWDAIKRVEEDIKECAEDSLVAELML